MIKYTNNYFPNCLISVIMIVTLAACSSTEDMELSRYIYDIKARKATPIDPIPDFVSIEKFLYPENDMRRSPFKKKEVPKVDDRLAPNTNRPKQPLEQFPLDALKFVGILKQDSTIWGLISQPDGSIARVRVGDYMGQNFGKIISISDTSLKLEETVQISGKWEKKVTTFNLNASE